MERAAGRQVLSLKLSEKLVMKLSLSVLREELDELESQWRGFSQLARIFAAWRVASWILAAFLPFAFLITIAEGLWIRGPLTIPVVLLGLGVILAATIASFDWLAEQAGVDEELSE